jgi:hypothetical protein
MRDSKKCTPCGHCIITNGIYSSCFEWWLYNLLSCLGNELVEVLLVLIFLSAFWTPEKAVLHQKRNEKEKRIRLKVCSSENFADYFDNNTASHINQLRPSLLLSCRDIPRTLDLPANSLKQPHKSFCFFVFSFLNDAYNH